MIQDHLDPSPEREPGVPRHFLEKGGSKSKREYDSISNDVGLLAVCFTSFAYADLISYELLMIRILLEKRQVSRLLDY